ncbi:MFS transporter [Gorillibacterium sp. sgz5001074]|uniref:MFS transporter n=1 Tax=Gorillibacterium sp. sgz5001074 TaxID=3446695 RepID=UPI003F669080
MNKLLRLGAWSYLATGFSHVLIGSILTALLQHYGGEYSEGGGLVFAQFFGFMIGVSTVGPSVQRLGRRNVLCAAMLVLFAAQLYAVLLPSWEVLIALLFIMGIAFGSIESSVGALILLAFKEKQAAAMGKLELYFGLGALLMPFFSGIFLLFGIWRYAFVPLGLLALLLAAAWRFTDFGLGSSEYLSRVPKSGPAGEDGSAPQASSASRGSRRLVLALFAAFFFLYVGVEVCLIEFAPSWMMDGYGLSPSASAWVVTLFWLTMSIGRAFIGALAERFSYYRYLLVSLAGTVLGTAGLAAAPSAWAAYASMALLGFAMAGLFAVALIYANSLASGREQATASLLISTGGVGGAVMPLLLGRWMDRFGSAASIWLMAGAAVIMLTMVLAALLLPKAADSSSECDGTMTV